MCSDSEVFQVSENSDEDFGSNLSESEGGHCRNFLKRIQPLTLGKLIFSKAGLEDMVRPEQPWPCSSLLFAHALFATCQLWAWWYRTIERSTDPAIIIATAPDSPPDLREEPGLGFQSVSMAVPVHFCFLQPWSGPPGPPPPPPPQPGPPPPPPPPPPGSDPEWWPNLLVYRGHVFCMSSKSRTPLFKILYTGPHWLDTPSWYYLSD